MDRKGTDEGTDVQGGKQSLVLSPELTAGLKTLSQKSGTTLFMTVLAGFKTLLSRLANQEDIIIGTPIANRDRIETEGMIGMLLNTLALRTDLSGQPRFQEVLERVREVTLGAYAHQDMPFEKLVEELQPERNLGRSPIFDVMVNMINTESTELQLPNLAITSLDAAEPESKFLMTLYIEELDGQLHLRLIYRSDLFAARRIDEMIGNSQLLLEQVIADPTRPINAYSLVTQEAQTLLPDPTSAVAQPHFATVMEQFKERAWQAPDQLALKQGERAWTYKQLADRAETLTRQLEQRVSVREMWWQS